MYGILISSALFGVIIFLVMMLINKFDIEKYEDLIKNNKVILAIIKSFTFICFCIMISAIGSYASEQYNISFWYGAIFAGVICFVSFLFKFNGLEKVNNLLVPLILIGIFLLSLLKYDASVNGFLTVATYTPIYMDNWFLSAFLYTGYNSILLLPILLELKIYKLKRGDILILSSLVSLILAIAGLWIYGVISMYYPDILDVELPTLALAEKCGVFVKCYYSVVILFAIFTTAFSCGFAFLRMNKEKNYFRNNFLMCFLGILLSRIGFSDMINLFFPIFGYLGILQILIIFLPRRRE